MMLASTLIIGAVALPMLLAVLWRSQFFWLLWLYSLGLAFSVTPASLAVVPSLHGALFGVPLFSLLAILSMAPAKMEALRYQMKFDAAPPRWRLFSVWLLGCLIVMASTTLGLSTVDEVIRGFYGETGSLELGSLQ